MPPKSRQETITTSIRVKEGKWKEARKAAIDYDISISELIEQAIDLWIKDKEKEK